MKPNKLLAPATLQAASAVNAKGLFLHKQYIKYFWEANILFFFNRHVTHQLFTHILKHNYYGMTMVTYLLK